MSDTARILFIDDDDIVLAAGEAMLRYLTHEVRAVSSKEEAIRVVQHESFDIVLIDQYLGTTKGTDLMPYLARLDPSLDFILLTGRPDVSLVVSAMKQGASDFLIKPFKSDDLQKSIEDVMKRRSKNNRKMLLLAQLEGRVRQMSEERQKNYIDILESFSRAVENRDLGTYGHSRRVSEYSSRIAAHLLLPPAEIDTVRAAALLHDIGKIGISDGILGKAGPLTDDELAIVRSHPQRGADILRPLKQLEPIIDVILHHHERFDGNGYPAGLSAEKIPFASRIIAVADTFDAICSVRPYRPAETVERAIRELISCSGTQFDPAVARAMIEILAKSDHIAVEAG